MCSDYEKKAGVDPEVAEDVLKQAMGRIKNYADKKHSVNR